MGRIRTKTVFRHGNYVATKFVSPFTVQKGDVSSSFKNKIDDIVHVYPFTAEGDLNTIKFSGQPARLNGIARAGLYDIVYRHCPFHMGLGQYTNTYTFPLLGWKNEALGKVQDIKADFDLPLQIAELKDLPGTIKSLFRGALSRARSLGVSAAPLAHAARTVAKHPTDVYLTQQFGINPIVGAVGDLLGIQESIARRMAQHEKKFRTKRSGGSLSSSAVFNWPGVAYTGGKSFPFIGTVLTDIEHNPTHKAWFTARLSPTIPLSDILHKVADNPLGIGEPTMETLWNVIPWSFLVDYFADVSDFLALQGNIMPYKVDSVCLMCTTVHRLREVPRPKIAYPNLSFSPSSITITRKFRWVYGNPTPQLALTPFLSGTQVANIAALAVSLSGGR